MSRDKVYQDGWSSLPEIDDRAHEFKIIRTPPKGLRGFRVLSHEPLGRYTHHWKGRTTPCKEENCKACAEGNQRRWYGWIFVVYLKTQEIFCYEYTKAAAATVHRYFSRNRTLRGAMLSAYRKERRTNGEVTLELITPPAGGDPIPKAPCRKKFLSRLWETNIKITSKDAPKEIEVENDQPTKVPENGRPVVRFKKA